MSTAFAAPAPTRSEVSFEQHARCCRYSIKTLWSQVEETGMTAREMYELMQQPQVRSLTTSALQQSDINKARPLAVLKVSQENRDVYDKTLLVVAITLVTVYRLPVIIMPNGSDGRSGYENRLMVIGDPPDFVR